MTTKLILATLAVLATEAAADVRVHNATTKELALECTFPNGDVKKETLSANTDSMDSGSFGVGPGIKQLKIKVLDDDNKPLWSGTLKDNDVYLLIPSGEGIKAVAAGTVTVGKETAKAVFMNLTGEAITIDLVGTGGLGAHRGIKPPAMFDPKKPLKLDARETYFKVTGKTKDGDAAFDLERVNRAYYYAIWKVPRSGKYRAEPLGRLP